MLKDIYKGASFVAITPFLFTGNVLAQSNTPPKLDATMIDRLVDIIISKLLPIAGLLAFVFIVYGGYMWMISGGDPEKIKRAQGTLTWSVIGLIFTILVGLILRAILKAIA